MSKEVSWVNTYKKKLTLSQCLSALEFLIPMALTFTFGFIGGSMTIYIDKNGTKVVDAKNPTFVWLSFACGLISLVVFIINFIRILHTRCDIANYKGHTIMAFVLNKKCKLIIDGVETESLRRMNFKDFVILNGITNDGIEVTCKIQDRSSKFSYREVEVVNGNQTTKIINNYSGSGKSNKDELTPTQKKLVEMAKNDTLASINPANVEDAKKRIDLYKDLDELDD